ncbi:hypothetical protein QEV83_02090 [Methylocapsa sp. D3K7]|uniref:hypothetical protein n=1 Tax=Methylocapsa sp. D3K7 TaxID=3041435 RepID=UPI00244E9704|nr:hypothetical protein [Methylocapsa sp. D3K7]WGJ15122.1 hypothetical protein QEV83_02090 [Methylocapsa sp. D3K7]
MRFATELLACSRSQSVPLAPLQTILAILIGAGVPSTAIPERIRRAAAELATLRLSLTNWEDEGPGHAQLRAETLALIDRGDFEAASKVLKRGRETGWTFPIATCREEAEYYVREAMIDHLQLRFCAAAEGYAAAALIADEGGIGAWRHLIAQAQELSADCREFGTRENVLRAIEIYHRALGLVGRERLPLEWAATQHHLGGAFLLLGESENDTGALREAVDVYLAALEESTFERAPADWTKAQIDLGDALQLIGERKSDPERLRQAAEAYRAALAEHTLETAPFDWAGVVNRLGNTLAALGFEDGGDRKRLAEAIDAYRKALNGIDSDHAPLAWAATQSNPGEALEAFGEEAGGIGLLHQAAAAYQAILDERCRDLAPSDLAAARANLDDALVTIAERENDNAFLEEAAVVYRAALEARPANEAPLDTARSHIKLACALGGLWNRTRNRQMLDEALAAVEAALCLMNEMPELSAAALMPERTVAAIGR